MKKFEVTIQAKLGDIGARIPGGDQQDENETPINVHIATKNLYATFDCHKNIILYSTSEGKWISDTHPDAPLLIETAFENCPFITIPKKDAQNIIDMLNYAIIKLESGERRDNDREVFGDKAISYERLIDRVNSLIY